MDISIFLAQVFGLYFVIVGSAMFLHPYMTKKMIIMGSSDRSIIFVTGMISLLVGIPLVLLHNIWDGSWRVVVTIVVWLVLIKGIVRVFAPDTVFSWALMFLEKPRLLRGFIVLLIILGLYLMYVGFGVSL